jgi:hypothetical protein
MGLLKTQYQSLDEMKNDLTKSPYAKKAFKNPFLKFAMLTT